jgi:hypothetical protein
MVQVRDCRLPPQAKPKTALFAVSNNEREDDETGVSRIPSHNTRSPGLAAPLSTVRGDCMTRLMVCGPQADIVRLKNSTLTPVKRTSRIKQLKPSGHAACLPLRDKSLGENVGGWGGVAKEISFSRNVAAY